MFHKLKWKLQKMFKDYCDNDIIDMTHWFQTVIPKMIMELEDWTHGYKPVSLELINLIDKKWVDKNCKFILERMKEQGFEIEDIKDNPVSDGFVRWRLVLRRIAYCLRESSEQFCSEINEYNEDHYNMVYRNPKLSHEDLIRIFESKEYKDLEKKMLKRNDEIENYKERMKDEAMDLLKEYLFALWT